MSWCEIVALAAYVLLFFLPLVDTLWYTRFKGRKTAESN